MTRAWSSEAQVRGRSGQAETHFARAPIPDAMWAELKRARRQGMVKERYIVVETLSPHTEGDEPSAR